METGEKPGPGDMLELGANKPGDPFWADVYDGSEGLVVYGHDPLWETGLPREAANAIGIDTGCVFGGNLTTLVVSERGKRETLSVPAVRRYAEPLEEKDD